jgi:hypothetical protein
MFTAPTLQDDTARGKGGNVMKAFGRSPGIGVALLLIAGLVHAQANITVRPEWPSPIAPVHIAGNLYYGGSKDLAS